MEQIADQKLPPAMGYEWTGMAYQEKRVGGEAIFVFAHGRAARLPGAGRPVRKLVHARGRDSGRAAGACWARWPPWPIRGMDNNVYTQIGIVLIIALASKNAILIVEFARELRNAGQERFATPRSKRRGMRFRPILMTSFAFILGVVPLVIATGAGAAGQQALGTAVFGGMIASTLLAVFFVPVFFVVMQRLSEFREPRRELSSVDRPPAPRPKAPPPTMEHAAPHP